MPVDASISFEAAIAHTQALLASAEAGDPVDATVDLTAEVAALVASPNGARGFFVAFLSGDSPLADDCPADIWVSILAGLRQSPDQVGTLMAKNLAMSTAMAIAHRRHDREEMAQGSDRVQARSLALIRQLDLPELTAQIQLMQVSALGAGTCDAEIESYAGFLDRWGYDAAQRAAIAQACTQALSS